MHSQRKKTLILIAITACFCLLLGEGLSRLLYSDRFQIDFTYHSNMRYDPLLGWSGMPGSSTVDKYGQRHDINADGLRDDDWKGKLAAVTPGRTQTILLLGDSTSYGLCIAKNERLGEQLEALYATDGKEAQVFNTGIPGYGTDQEYLALLRHISRVKPNAVALYFCPNDFGDAALPYDHRAPHRRCYKPWFDDQGHLAINAAPVPMRFSQRVKNTCIAPLRLKYMVDDLQCLVDDVRYRLAGVSPNRRLNDASGPLADMDQLPFDPRYNDLFQANKNRVFTLLARIRDICMAANARFVVLSNAGRTTAYGRELFDTFRSLGVEAVSTYALVHAHFDLTHFSYVQGDGHPNFLQNLINATVLYNALEHTSQPVRPSRAPWYDALPHILNFGRVDIDKYLFGAWQASETSGRWFDRDARCLLRGVGSNASEILVLDFSSARSGVFHVRVDNVVHALQVPAPGLYRARLPMPGAELHALAFRSNAFIGDDMSHNGDMRSLSYYLVSARAEPAPGCVRSEVLEKLQ